MPGKTALSTLVYTIGHSNHPIGRFLNLLHGADIEVVLDVRSIPQSRRFPQFGRRRLQEALAAAGIDYVFLGDLLGGKPGDPAVRRNGMVDYDLVAAAPAFQAGLKQARREAATRRATLMCAEKAPLDCHRTVLIARHLVARGDEITHLLADGAQLPHAAIEDELLKRYGPADDLLATTMDRDTRLQIAYRRRGEQMMAAKAR